MKTRFFALFALGLLTAGAANAQLKSYASEGGLWGYKNAKGETVVAPQFDVAQAELKAELTPTSKNKKFGYLDRQGKAVIPFIYDYAYGFGANGAANLALVNVGCPDWRTEAEFKNILMGHLSGLHGMIDKAGKVVIPIEYTHIGWFNGGIVPVSKSPQIAQEVKGSSDKGRRMNGLYGFLDQQGRTVVEPTYDFVEFASPNGFFVVGSKFKYGAIDTTGKVVVPLRYSYKEALKRASKRD